MPLSREGNKNTEKEKDCICSIFQKTEMLQIRSFLYSPPGNEPSCHTCSEAWRMQRAKSHAVRIYIQWRITCSEDSYAVEIPI
jgi:hypothetical protein